MIKANLILSGFVQVYFVAINTICLAKGNYLGVFIVSYIISLVWSFNVKKIAFGSNADRFIYAIGAAIGGVAGVFTTSLFAQ